MDLLWLAAADGLCSIYPPLSENSAVVGKAQILAYSMADVLATQLNIKVDGLDQLSGIADLRNGAYSTR